MNKGDLKQLISIPVIVAALGYFVDIYDLLLFSIVWGPSLKEIGVPEAQLELEGQFLLQIQMAGMLIGGIIWGIMGDKRGRLSVLFGSILLYSVANIANSFVTDLTQYAILRFIAGVGLAGELGAGITLVSEVLPTRLRGYGTMLVASIGLVGAVVANLVSQVTTWHTSYLIGGGLGLLLLIARISVFESGIFMQIKQSSVERGNFFKLFTKKERFVRFLRCIMIGLPLWFVVGILITFSPKFVSYLGFPPDTFPSKALPGNAVMLTYIGLVFGDLSSGLLSQMARSRKKIVLLFILLTMAFVLLYLWAPVKTSTFFYITCFLLGFAVGYWVLFVTIAAEQFGTNLRATVTTAVPNFVRGAVVPIAMLFQFFRKSLTESYGEATAYLWSALVVGMITVALALMALRWMSESFNTDLDFVEKD